MLISIRSSSSIQVRERSVDRGLEVQRHAGAEPGGASLGDGRLRIVDRLVMERDDVEAGIGELLEEGGRLIHHQVAVERTIGPRRSEATTTVPSEIGGTK